MMKFGFRTRGALGTRPAKLVDAAATMDFRVACLVSKGTHVMVAHVAVPEPATDRFLAPGAVEKGKLTKGRNRFHESNCGSVHHPYGRRRVRLPADSSL